MKKFISVFALIVFAFSYAGFGQEIKRVEPKFWWVGMNNPNLQLLVYGENISNLTPSIDYQGLKLKQVTTTQNPNYLFLDLRIDESAKAGNFNIQFTKDDEVVNSYTYELKERKSGSSKRKGFNSSDVIYLLMPDRFANGNPENDEVPSMKEGLNRDKPGGRHGGDIQGIINHLDYIDEMGFTAIWLNPVLENNQPHHSYHGYSTTDYYQVDPRFGSNELYKELSEKAREKGIKLIMDMIPNHCGSEHWWIKDPPSNNWVHYQDNYTNTNHQRSTLWDPHASKIDKRQFKNGWFVKSMPDLNQENPLMANYLIQNAIWWVEYAGLRGIRVDTYPYSGKEFMQAWTCRVMEEYPDLNIVGEEWSYNNGIVSSWQRGKNNQEDYKSCLPSLMDFPTQQALSSALTGDEGWDSGMIKLYRSIANDFMYPEPLNLVLLPDNHDMSRFYTQVNGDYKLFKLGIMFTATTRGIPQYLYGTEILKANPNSGDHGIIRSDMPGGWAGDEANAFTGEGLSSKKKDAQEFMKKLLNWRKNEEVIHTGELTHYIPQNECYVYFRHNDEKTIMVALNKNKDNSYKINTSRFQECLKGKNSGVNALTGEQIDNLDNYKIKPKSGVIIEVKN